jgi:hypothetical protein
MSVCVARQLPPNCQSSFIPQKARNRLFALIMLVFATATLEAQTLAPTQLQEFNTAVQPASRFETYRQPVIPTVGRSGFIGHEGPHAVTIETVVAFAQQQDRLLLRFVDSRARSPITSRKGASWFSIPSRACHRRSGRAPVFAEYPYRLRT